MTKSTLSAALFYAKLGWPIIPVWSVNVDEQGNAICHCGNEECNVPGKHPVSYFNGAAIAPRGVKDATTDTDTIQAWWKQYPSANIGAAGTKWFALDIDRPEARFEFDKLPDTVESISGSGGSHILFNQPTTWKVGNYTGDLPEGIDVRGCASDGSPRGYIILPPSMHKSGKRYEWELSSHPRDIEVADAPIWLLEVLKEAQRKEVHTSITKVDAPDLAVFDISAATRERILHGHDSGEDRSQMDMRVCVALVEASATPSEIAAIFRKYPIGTAGKLSDHNSPENYLQHTIDSAFSWTVAKTPKKVIPSKIQPNTNVTEEEAKYEEIALGIAYQQGWTDALAGNPAIAEVLWPEYLQPSVEMIKHYGIGVQMDYAVAEGDDREFAALVVPYYNSGNMSVIDLTIHQPPEEYPARVWQSEGSPAIFDTEFDRTSRIESKVIVASDWDEAIRLQEIGLTGYEILAQPASCQRSKRARELAEVLADCERVVLAWPNNRRREGEILASLLEAGGERVRWASMPASLRGMLSIYSLGIEQFVRILEMSNSVLS